MRDFSELDQNAGDFDLDQESLPSSMYKPEFEINHDLNTIYESVEKESSSIDESIETLAKESPPLGASQAELTASEAMPHKEDLVLEISNSKNESEVKA